MNSNKRRPDSGKRSRRPLIILAVIAVIIVAIIIPIAPYLFSSAHSTAVIHIPVGADSRELSDTLKKHYGEAYTARVMRVMDMLKADIGERHGAYTIEEGMSPLSAGRQLARGEQTPVKLTINGFRSADLLAERIARKFDFSKDDFLKALDDPELRTRYGLKESQQLALFLDDTYHVYWDATPREVIDKIGENYKKVWNQERTAKAKALGLTPAEAVIICSITDEETAKNDEKGRIARLYVNRLKKGMKLQADPTVRFAIGDFTIRRVTRPMLSTDSPYNTYMHAGLPPGPIRTTSTTTIDALLSSSPSDDIFMCAREDFSGYHNFSSSYSEHEQNAKRYQQKLNELNIK